MNISGCHTASHHVDENKVSAAFYNDICLSSIKLCLNGSGRYRPVLFRDHPRFCPCMASLIELFSVREHKNRAILLDRQVGDLSKPRGQ